MQVLMKDPFTKGSFAGVYACDELSSTKIKKYPKSFVVNTDPMELPGTHSIAIYFNEQMKRAFFDSYGKHPIYYNKYFLDFMNRNAGNIIRYSFKVLSPLSVDNTVHIFCVIPVGRD